MGFHLNMELPSFWSAPGSGMAFHLRTEGELSLSLLTSSSAIEPLGRPTNIGFIHETFLADRAGCWCDRACASDGLNPGTPFARMAADLAKTACTEDIADIPLLAVVSQMPRRPATASDSDTGAADLDIVSNGVEQLVAVRRGGRGPFPMP